MEKKNDMGEGQRVSMETGDHRKKDLRRREFRRALIFFFFVGDDGLTLLGERQEVMREDEAGDQHQQEEA